ncbi:transporter [Variovorax sp. J22R133]|uniref:SphA family protein n=1 Tax=Variovorax brevis TaxID=3053503 RepID=UPI0025759B54|nr:transporter [Variovorax sp. J22R133]MDM0110562.1 transporter [Variovorax sp. J22R133]
MQAGQFKFAAAALLVSASTVSQADEGGMSFWLPGQFGSFAAVPGDPGWSLPLVYYHTSADAGVGKSFPRGGQVRAGLDVTADLLFAIPTYVFTEPLLGGQASVSVAGVFGRTKVGVDATLTGPGGLTRTGSQSDSLTGGGDLYPSAYLKWNRGVHNFMAYTMAGVPVGAYQAERLANLGTNHWSLDAGGGYTYLDPKAGHEFSATLGFTYNFENPDTDYQNGIDGHLDWAASQFLSEQLHVGLVGYFYQQLTGDSGAGATLGDFKSRVYAVGPQIGYFFPVGGQKWYVNLKGYYEFEARNRPKGWNTWITLAIPFGGQKK